MRASFWLGAITVALGALATIGWVAHIETLTTVLPDRPPQKFLTGVLMLLAGASLTVRRRGVSVVLSAATAALATAIVLEWSLGIDLHIDQLWVHDPSHTVFPGRPARITAIAMLLAAALVLVGDARDRVRTTARRAVMAMLVLVTLMVALAYVFDAHEVSSRGTSVPVLSGLGIATLAAAALARTTYEPPLAWLWDRGTVGTLTRRLLPATLLAPPLLGWAFQAGARAGHYSEPLAMLLFTTATTAMLTAATVAIGTAVARSDRDRDLLASELAATFDHLPASMSLRDTHGTFLRTNRMFERHTHLKSEDVLGKPINEIYPAELLPWAQAEIDEVLASAHATHSEREADLGDGPRVFDVTRYPVRDGDGEVIGLGTFTLDITDRKRAETAATSAAARVEAFLESAPDAIVVVDDRGIIRYANPQIEKLLGYPNADVVGMSVEMLVPDSVRGHHEHLRERYGEHPTVRAMGGRGLTARHRDGHEVDVEISLGPAHLPEGNWTLAAIRDVTARRRAEQAAESAAARIEAFLEAAPDAIIVVDDHGVIQYANPQLEPMLGYATADVVGKRVEMLVPDSVRDHHHDLRERYAEHPTLRPMGGRGLTARHRDGHEVAVEISLGPAKTPEGNWTLAAIRDVTTRRASEERIRAAEKRFRDELDLAERIQRRLMPTELPQPAGWDLAVTFTPASHVGGDFYDCWMPDHDLRVVVADVMGKGVSAALVGSGFRVTVNSALTAEEPAKAVRRVAHDMSADLTHTGRFVTCFAARIDPLAGQVHWVDAGHGLAFVLRADGGHSWLRGTDLPVGVLPESEWSEHVSAIEPGDMLVVVSDGLVDHFESADALLARLDGGAGCSAKSVLDSLVDGLGEPSDDVTAFAIRRELVS